MAYQIEYNIDRITVFRKNFKRDLLIGFLLTCMLLTGTIGMHLCGFFLQRIICFDRHQTYAAAERLVDDIKTGVPIQDAVQVFCEELIQ